MTTVEAQTREKTRVFITGNCEGLTELSDALGRHSELELVGHADHVSAGAGALTGGHLQAVLHATRSSALPADDIAAIREYTQAPIVLVASGEASALLEEALDADVADVLLLPQLTENVVFAIRKASHSGRRSKKGHTRGNGRVITVFSPKGGTGKTVTATNLSVCFAKNAGKKTLLLDLDLQFGDAAIMLGIEPEKTIQDLVTAPGELDPEKLAGYTTRHSSGLDVLPAPIRPEDAELVTEAKLARLMEVAKESYEVIVVDTSPFFHGPMLATLDQSDDLLLVCGLDVPTIKNVRLSLQTLQLLSFPVERVRVVLNRANSNVGHEEGRGRGRARDEDPFRGAERPRRAVGGQPLEPGRALRPEVGLRPCGPRDGEEPHAGEGRRERKATVPRKERELDHGPSRPHQGQRTATPLRTSSPPRSPRARPSASSRRRTRPSDPYAELKTRVHHACIAKLGPHLFTTETSENLNERVLREVTEQLALDRTPLTREERRRIVREITDDILGYGPLEPLLRDDTVTEVMVNNFDRIFIERDGKLERSTTTFADNAHLLRIIDKIVSQVGRRIDESSPMVDARLPDGSRVNAIIPPLSLRGPTMTIRKFSRDPYTMDDLISLRDAHPEGGPVPRRLHAREAERAHLRWYRYR